MKEALQDSMFFGAALSIGTYILGVLIKRRWNFL